MPRVTPRTGLPAEVPTLGDLRARREEILRITAQYSARNVRVFGSVARGSRIAPSDVDLLVDIPDALDGFAYFGRLEDLRRALRLIIGRPVDIIDSAGLRRLRERILGEAVTL